MIILNRFVTKKLFVNENVVKAVFPILHSSTCLIVVALYPAKQLIFLFVCSNFSPFSCNMTSSL